jgi:hypothetical protein
MRRLSKAEISKAEIDRRWPHNKTLENKKCLCAKGDATAEDMAALIAAVAAQPTAALPAGGYRIVGKWIETITTRDRVEALAAGGYACNSVRPTTRNTYPFEVIAGPEWRIHDSSKDHHTVWCRDIFLIVEART